MRGSSPLTPSRLAAWTAGETSFRCVLFAAEGGRKPEKRLNDESEKKEKAK